MTDKYLQQKFGELIYELGEIDFDAIKNEFWEKYINENTPFNEKQLEALRYFALDLIEHELSEIAKTYTR
jgi:Fe-S cluster biosynthesis and repair protein YggX